MKRSILISIISIFVELGIMYTIEYLCGLFTESKYHFVIALPLFISITLLINFLIVPLCIRRHSDTNDQALKEMLFIRLIFNGICYVISFFLIYGTYANPDILISLELLQPIIQRTDMIFTVLGYITTIALLILLPIIRLLLLKAGLKVFTKTKK